MPFPLGPDLLAGHFLIVFHYKRTAAETTRQDSNRIERMAKDEIKFGFSKNLYYFLNSWPEDSTQD